MSSGPEHQTEPATDLARRPRPGHGQRPEPHPRARAGGGRARPGRHGLDHRAAAPAALRHRPRRRVLLGRRGQRQHRRRAVVRRARAGRRRLQPDRLPARGHRGARRRHRAPDPSGTQPAALAGRDPRLRTTGSSPAARSACRTWPADHPTRRCSSVSAVGRFGGEQPSREGTHVRRCHARRIQPSRTGRPGAAGPRGDRGVVRRGHQQAARVHRSGHLRPRLRQHGVVRLGGHLHRRRRPASCVTAATPSTSSQRTRPSSRPATC